MAEIRARIERSQTSRRSLTSDVASTGSGSDPVAEPAEATAAIAVPPIHPAAPTDNLYTDMLTARSHADVSQLPLSIASRQRGIGGVVRRGLHNLMLYYVNMLAAKQSAFNRATVSALTRIVDQLERRDIQRIIALEREVRELKAQLKGKDDTP